MAAAKSSRLVGLVLVAIMIVLLAGCTPDPNGPGLLTPSEKPIIDVPVLTPVYRLVGPEGETLQYIYEFELEGKHCVLAVDAFYYSATSYSETNAASTIDCSD